MSTLQHTSNPRYNALMRYAKMLGFGEIHTEIDSKIGLQAIIAIHSTKLGPAIGGCRFYEYKTHELAIKDVLRLAYGMTLKAAACDLPYGGAKAVIIKPKKIIDRAALLRGFGDFVQKLNGRYITAVDVGSDLDDMTIIAERTPYVVGAKLPGRVDEDPSPSTARGVFRAMQAAVQFKWKRDHFKNLHVAIQGVGRVGFELAKLLVEHGARVTIADINRKAAEKCAQALRVNVADVKDIESIECDIFSPCALGGTLNLDFIHKNKAKIIAGSANNQLAHHTFTHVLAMHDVLYLPDFFINSGGLINAVMVYTYQDISMADKKIDTLYEKTLILLERAAKTNKTTTRVAEEMALEKLK